MKSFLTFAVVLCYYSGTIFSQNTTVSGMLTAAGGKTINIAHVHVSNSNTIKGKAVTYDVHSNGTFTFSLPNGWHRLQFSGVDYAATPSFPMEVYCCGEPMKLNVQLAANSAPKIVDSVKIVSEINDYNFAKATPMTKQKDGTFSIEIKTDKPILGYQVLVYGDDQKGEHSINGTMSDHYEYDGGGDYRSIIRSKNGVVKIVFDPKKLPENNGTASAKFTDEFSKAVKAIIDEETVDRQVFFTAYSNRKVGKPEHYNPIEAHEKVQNLAVNETNQYLKELRMLQYLSVNFFSKDTSGLDADFVKTILTTIQPASSVWGHNPRLVSIAVEAVGDNEYMKRVIKENPSPYVQSEVLNSLLQSATKDKNETLAREYYKKMMSDYPETYAARYAEKAFNPDRKVKKGNPIPNFSFDGIEENTGTKLTPAELKGKWVLIDNWATWCGPCIAELPALHKIYEKFKDKNFVVLSISFDREANDVTKFRKGKFKMPWMHVFSEGVWESEAAKIFEVSGIPKPILIDPNGKIVALEEELRSDTLEKTLEQFVR